MSSSLPAIAIVGRPNVGKSTLFNRMVGKSLALVHDQPGVTRDSKESVALWRGCACRLFDTPGLEENKDKASLSARMTAKASSTIAEADLVLLVIDARAGILPDDKTFARILRKAGKSVIVVLNKAETPAIAALGAAEATPLGFGEPVAISAAHNLGMVDLWDAMIAKEPRLHQPIEPEDETDEETEAEPAEDEAANYWRTRPLRLIIIGRPNVGKSTLTNTLLGSERMLTGPEAGLTRESIMHDWAWKDRPIQLVDTAGMRRKSRIEETLEDMSVGETLRAIRLAHVAILVLDATRGCEKQDLQIARHVVEEGRALVVAVNKWDAVADKAKTLKVIGDELSWSLAQVRNVPLVTISAMRGKGLNDLMREVLKTETRWNKRIGTGALNRWLEAALARNQPPLVSGRRLKLRYMTQFKSRPPTFALWSNRALSDMPESYLRYLANGLTADFDLAGVPIRWVMRKSENPFAEKKEGGSERTRAAERRQKR